MSERLDKTLAGLGLVQSRSQAESYIRLGKVKVAGKVVTKTGYMVHDPAEVTLEQEEQYVSRAGLKLASVAGQFGVDFAGKIVLDVGSSTGGFTDYSLKRGARKVYAVEVGTNQLHPSLHGNERIELHEQTDIRDFSPDETPDIVVIDVSFISLREILPHVAKISGPKTQILAMVKPQFEAVASKFKHKGVVKNDRMRRDILQDFEQWAKVGFLTKDKADSQVAGEKGNLERFYVLQPIKKP